MANSFKYKDQTFHSGDRVVVHLKIKEEGKTRTQSFEGLIIAIKGRGVGQTFTIRKIASNSWGVERNLPLMSPNIDKIELKSAGKTRRAKLYYLRDRIGKRALRVKENKNINGNQSVSTARAKSGKTSSKVSSV